ncbi:MAG TPA: YqgE/AlgH family protein [bacterium]|nr:YqgE/AlgH family protein [bacterium]
MNADTSLKNHLLIAMPHMGDPNFAQTVTYICQHDENGAMGIVINRLMEVSLGDVLEHLNIAPDTPEIRAQSIHYGGPASLERGFVLHTPQGPWDSTLNLPDDLGLTTSRDILQAIGHGAGPSKRLIALGFAGWGAGQLEQEMLDNAWLSTPATHAILFDLPEDQRWHAAARQIGIDLNLLSAQAGHA